MNVCCRLDLERVLAFHSAPTLMGCKPANLVAVQGDCHVIQDLIREFNVRARDKGLRAIPLRQRCGCTLVMVCDVGLMDRQLEDRDVHRLFEDFGYGCCQCLGSYLTRLRERLREQDFPHEIGLFLGYPTEDVRGFIKNHGENYKLCGYWKVYSNEDRARAAFESYDRCRRFVTGLLDRGEDLYSALDLGRGA